MYILHQATIVWDLTSSPLERVFARKDLKIPLEIFRFSKTLTNIYQQTNMTMFFILCCKETSKSSLLKQEWPKLIPERE